MKKLWLFAACFAACFPALAADDSLRVDAQSRLENIRRKAPELARGSRQVVTHVSASLQVNDATVLELLCEKPESDGRTLRLWSGALLREGNVLPPARILTHLLLGLDGRQDAVGRRGGCGSIAGISPGIRTGQGGALSDIANQLIFSYNIYANLSAFAQYSGKIYMKD